MIKNPRVRVSSETLLDESSQEAFSTPGRLHVDDSDFGLGEIKITNQCIAFIGYGKNVSFDYRSMVMHAITGDENNKYIFVQLLADEDEEVEAEVIKLIPSDQSVISSLFEAINEMSALNPDEALSEDYDACEDDCV
jgi:hypothetical protein